MVYIYCIIHEYCVMKCLHMHVNHNLLRHTMFSLFTVYICQMSSLQAFHLCTCLGSVWLLSGDHTLHLSNNNNYNHFITAFIDKCSRSCLFLVQLGGSTRNSAGHCLSSYNYHMTCPHTGAMPLTICLDTMY